MQRTRRNDSIFIVFFSFLFEVLLLFILLLPRLSVVCGFDTFASIQMNDFHFGVVVQFWIAKLCWNKYTVYTSTVSTQCLRGNRTDVDQGNNNAIRTTKYNREINNRLCAGGRRWVFVNFAEAAKSQKSNKRNGNRIDTKITLNYWTISRNKCRELFCTIFSLHGNNGYESFYDFAGTGHSIERNVGNVSGRCTAPL